MSNRLPPFAALRAFEAAARLLSFRKAAGELHVTPSAISQQVRSLEDFVGVTLFRRLPRSLELTPAGAALLPGVREGFGRLSGALAEVMPQAAHLSVSAPPTFARRWLVPRLQRFNQAHPGVELRLTSSAAMVDGREHAAEPAPADPRAGPAAAIRYGKGHYEGARVDRLLDASYVPVCSPLLLQGEHPLRLPADLRHHTLLHDDTVPEERVKPTWEAWLERAGVADVDATRGPRFSEASLAIDAAADGQGVALALHPLVKSEVEAGRLAIPFDTPVPSSYAYYLVTPEQGARAPALEAFRDWVLTEARAK